MENIIIATVKKWNKSNYFMLKDDYQDSFHFHLMVNKNELTKVNIDKLNPKYIFFPHWSWMIPQEIYDNFECVVFHMTDLPYGRGGSPLQNLIIRGVYDTKISALRVDNGIDTGDIYLKESFNISTGNAEENFIKLSSIIFSKMIPKFLKSKLIAKSQTGDIVNFKRRKPKDSDIKTIKDKTLIKLYDFVRMLDAQDYPKAYVELDDIKIEFSKAIIKDNKLVGTFEVIKDE